MRDIKFRAKEIKTGKWLYGNLQVPKKEGVGYYMWDEEGFQCEVDPKTIGEFTSLKGKDNVDIYEGDVIGVEWEGDPFITDDVLEVRFVRGVFAFLWNGNLDEESPTDAPTHLWAKVLGNIHDNPELIKNQ